MTKRELEERCQFLERSLKLCRQAQRKQWMPTSEQNPEKDGFYIATCDGEICGEKEPFTGLAEFENGKWVDDEPDYKCILAWMELPEAYKGE